MINVVNKGGKIAGTVLLIGQGTLILESGSNIRDYSVIEMANDASMTVGRNSVIGYHSFVQCSGYKFEIGEDCLLGPHVSYITTSHPINGLRRKQPLVRGSIEIGNNVWIGTNATILKWVKIGNNSIVGANAMVLDETVIADNEIWVGVPAKKLRNTK